MQHNALRRAHSVWEAAMVSIDHFRQGLQAQMFRTAHGGLIDVLINAGELHRSLGSYPGSTHGMPSCCDAMQAVMKRGDTMLLDRTSGVGMTVRYLLPRAPE
jgi:5-methylcytosine-specific restriction protein A